MTKRSQLKYLLSVTLVAVLFGAVTTVYFEQSRVTALDILKRNGAVMSGWRFPFGENPSWENQTDYSNRFGARPLHVSTGPSKIVPQRQLGLAIKTLQPTELLMIDCKDISDDLLRCVADTSSITLLELYGSTPMGDDQVAIIASLTELTCLGLAESEVTDRSIDNLGRLSNLRELYLDRTRLSPSGITKLRGLLPKTQISADME